MEKPESDPSPRRVPARLALVCTVLGALAVPRLAPAQPAAAPSGPQAATAGDAATVALEPPYRHESGHAYLVPAPADWPSDGPAGLESRLVVLEDGVPLGPAHAVHDEIRRLGEGRYSHWGGSLWFSTSDNSDPNTNGRRYTVARPRRRPGEARWSPWPTPRPFDGLDDVALATAVAGRTAEPSPAAPTLVYWYTIDALRLDASRASDAEGPLMPALAAFSREAVGFDRAYAASSFTKTSTASMFSGLWPQRHGVMHGLVHAWPEDAALVFDLDPRVYTLAELLADHGYETWTHLYTVHVEPGSGLLQGFGHVDLASSAPAPLDALPERLFVYEHVLGAHAPYVPSPRAAARVGLAADGPVDPATTDWFYRPLDEAAAEHLRDAYRAEVVDADRRLGERLDWLRASGRWDEALIIVTADHGEEFLEHGSTQHSVQLYEEVVRVPLLVKFPSDHPWAAHHGTTLPHRVRHVDILPTIAELVAPGGTDALPYPVDGRSLGPILAGRETDPDRRDALFRASFTSPVEGTERTALFVTDAITSGRLKAHVGWRIRSSQAPSRRAFAQGDWVAELYDVAVDAREAFDLAEARPDDFERLVGRLAETAGRSLATSPEPAGDEDDSAAAGAEVSGDLLQQLRELGYLGPAELLESRRHEDDG